MKVSYYIYSGTSFIGTLQRSWKLVKDNKRFLLQPVECLSVSSCFLQGSSVNSIDKSLSAFHVFQRWLQLRF